MRKKFRNSDPDRFLRVDSVKADLKGHSVRGGAVTVATEIIKFLLYLGSFAILARLLLPEDYGLLGMVNVVLVFFGLFEDLGLATATVQAPEINHKQVSTLFWINVALGFTLFLIFAALSPLLALFYREPRLIGITIALGSNFIFSSLSVQHRAILRRQMQFASLARMQLVAMASGLLVAIAAASYGMGYWSLVILQLAMSITGLVGFWSVCGWRPGLPQWTPEVRSMVSFGGNVTGFYFFDYLSRNLDNILIGRFWGAQQLGLYAKAYQLLMLPIQQFTGPISGVALSALSRLREEPERYRSYYYKSTQFIATLGMPVVVFMFVALDKVILTVLGEQWLGIVPIFRFLAPAAFLGTFTWTGWVYQSLGRGDRMLRWGVISSTVDVIAFVIGVRWGTLGIATAFSLSQLILLIPNFVYCFKGTSLKMSQLAIAVSRPAIASIGAGAITLGIGQQFLNIPNVALGFLVDCILYGLFYFGLWLLLPGGKSTLLEMLQTVKTLKSKPKEALE
ncbi:lipopolysaccharide biosynthesis protein [Hydrococcus rivularis NIES-593]|uniref:Lipopolysaccharide biosynthesis protein n=1 Tax=Hydrococcus rivularis NIES-593 TaxID=1921803 RepID=A0A1U7HHN4_9CYAN|nr:lipopolysaccharide biosynthesis protein [Hydrococcus rivularis NIES-593]